ncbi:anti-sigma factor domain-containing protein [Pedobacter sp. SYSU D00535]|uniref:anti-sigma factor n=1 Tax=Pedobacter sp. SYSU D00535 TaxID=2810308 RepID=UPI001A96A547|nr:anti-sigma factor [Pedobacter sp. SYSU D00535]
MKDLKAYIESGVLELYVLGDLTQSERQEVELMLARHPELKAELTEIEKALDLYAEKHAIAPAEKLRDRVIDSLVLADEPRVFEEETREPVIKQSNFYKYGFAASVALLLLSIIVIINLRSQLQESNQRIASLELSNQKFSSRVNHIENSLSSVTEALEIYQNPAFKKVRLVGTPKAPEASMVVAFNPAEKEVMIDLASLKMPATDQQHQYQLWALVDGKPVDLGVFDTKTDTTGMIRMKAVNEAQAFAVTLEPRGGSIAPTLEQMMAMGSI